MRKLKIIEHMSVDGVIQAPGGPEEDPRYPYGGWAFPHRDPAVGEAIERTHGPSFDLLLGRYTYDIWTRYWPQAEGPMGKAINTAKKYIATHRPESLTWGPAEGLGEDIVAGVRRVKALAGPDLIVWGSSTVTPVLIEHELADEIVLLVYPVLLGVGNRLFAEGRPPPRELALVDSRIAATGVVINTYRPNGPLRTGSFADAGE